MANIQSELKEHLKNASDWAKMETPIQGVYVVKVPATKTRPALLFLEVNPLKDDGTPMKKRGLFVGNIEMLMKFHDTLGEGKVFELMTEIEKVNPKETSGEITKKLDW